MELRPRRRARDALHREAGDPATARHDARLEPERTRPAGEQKGEITLRRAALWLALLVIVPGLAAPTCSPAFPPKGTPRRVTHNRDFERPYAISAGLLVFGGTRSIKALDRDSETTRSVSNDFQIGVSASDEYVVWQTPFSTVYFLKTWSRLTGQTVFLDTERRGTFGRREFIDTRFIYSDSFDDYLRIWDPETDTIEELRPECITSWDATATTLAWTCASQGLVFIYELQTGDIHEIESPGRPDQIALADDWVVWTAVSGSDADILAAPLSGGPTRTLAANLPDGFRFKDFAAAGEFTAWWQSGRLKLHHLPMNTTIDVGLDVLRTAPLLTPRYLIWREGPFSPQFLRIRNLATGLEMADGPTEPHRFDSVIAHVDSVTYMSASERDVFLLEIDGDGDGLRDRDERNLSLGDLDVADSDGDGVLDGAEDPDLDQLSSSDELDVYGTNPLEPDTDSDALVDGLEALILGLDPLSRDSDRDGLPDGSEDADGDGLSNAAEAGSTPGEVIDTDGDGLPDVIDDDDDGDGVPTREDNCPVVPNPDQSDVDGDLLGDACDGDIDGDAISNEDDNCPLDSNPGQVDFDGDGQGDACDDDSDGDGVIDFQDSCIPTALDALVDASGCSLAQRCPCGDPWKNHGAYVSCVAKAASDFRNEGLLSGAERGAIVSAAGQSSCGR